MANEASIRSSLIIRKGSLDYSSRPSAFNVTVSLAVGPTPGVMTVDNEGENVDLSELTTPGLCRIMNLDDTNRMEYGIWDPEGVKFYPLGEADPGETYVIKLSRNIQEEYGTGTGTEGPDTNRLHVRAITGATCVVLVEAFNA